MAKYEVTHDALNGSIEIVRSLQLELVVAILKDNGRAMGGCIGSITGTHGHYELESIYIENEVENSCECTIMCHLNYPAFEVDADFQYLSIDERQQIVELLINESQKL